MKLRGLWLKSVEMDSQNLHLYIDFVGSSGVILSPEQKAALQTSLVILKSNHKFAHVKLWGKILGVKDDYYIAQGFSEDQLADKTTLYRSDISLRCNCIVVFTARQHS